MYYIGLDVHKKTISYCVKDASGQIHQEGQVGATRWELDDWMKTLPQPWTVAMEATIFTGWIYDHLLPHAQQVKVAEAFDPLGQQRIRESMRLWKHGQGYDSDGLDYIISLRVEHYLRQQEERRLKKGDRVALLGRGIAVVEQGDEKEAVVVMGSGDAFRIAHKDLVLSQRNLRWECEAKPQLLRS
jgi:hypothetical protein